MQKKSEKITLIRLGRLIRALRQSRTISQEELADLAGVHRTYIGMVERGEKNITIITLNRLADALGVNISDITKGMENGK